MSLINLKYAKVRDVKSPEYGTEGSLGLDIFIPNYDEAFKTEYFRLNNYPKIFRTYGFNVNNHTMETHENFYPVPDISVGLKINPKESLMIPSGIHFDLSENDIGLLAVNKSGVAAKKALKVGACLIDNDYQGEYIINIHNDGHDTIELNYGMKLVQLIIVPKYRVMLREYSIQKLYTNQSLRGEKGFGSTGDA